MAPALQNKWAIATVSLGTHPSHTLERKITAAAENGFRGIELVQPQLLAHAKQNNLTPLESAAKVKSMCASLGLEVLSLNPLKNFEGHPSLSLQQRLDNAQEWLELAVAAGAQNLQVPSQFIAGANGSDDVIIPELQALADLAVKSGLNIAYEAVAFAHTNALWQDSLRVVNAVDRPNFGLCLDSYHIHGRIWGDPYATRGQLENGDAALKESMTDFLATCPKEKVLYMQFSDASRFDPPLTDDSPLFNGLEVHDARLAWSRGCRPFPLEAPGYFPVVDIAKTWLLEYGWKGWVSLEGFLTETSLEENGPETMARRAKESVAALCSQLE